MVEWMIKSIIIMFVGLILIIGYDAYRIYQGQIQCTQLCYERGFVYVDWHKGYCTCLKCNEHGICEDEVKIRR